MTTAESEQQARRPRPVIAAAAGVLCLAIAIAIAAVGIGKMLDRAKAATAPRIVPVELVRDASGQFQVDVALCAGGVRAVGIRAFADSGAAGADGATNEASGGAVLWELHMQDVSLDTGDDAGSLAKGDMTGTYPVSDERIGKMTLAQPAPAKLPKLVIVEVITSRGTGSGVFDTSTPEPESATPQPKDCEDA